MKKLKLFTDQRVKLHSSEKTFLFMCSLLCSVLIFIVGLSLYLQKGFQNIIIGLIMGMIGVWAPVLTYRTLTGKGIFWKKVKKRLPKTPSLIRLYYTSNNMAVSKVDDALDKILHLFYVTASIYFDEPIDNGINIVNFLTNIRDRNDLIIEQKCCLDWINSTAFPYLVRDIARSNFSFDKNIFNKLEKLANDIEETIVQRDSNSELSDMLLAVIDELKAILVISNDNNKLTYVSYESKGISS